MISEEREPQKHLKDQFMIPQSTQSLIDTSPSGLFKLVDQNSLVVVSETDLEIGFRQLKETLAQRNMNYKVLLFDIDSPQ